MSFLSISIVRYIVNSTSFSFPLYSVSSIVPFSPQNYSYRAPRAPTKVVITSTNCTLSVSINNEQPSKEADSSDVIGDVIVVGGDESSKMKVNNGVTDENESSEKLIEQNVTNTARVHAKLSSLDRTAELSRRMLSSFSSQSAEDENAGDWTPEIPFRNVSETN